MFSNYYDTSIFIGSLDQGNKAQNCCLSLLDPETLPEAWQLFTSEITYAESCIDEYLNELEISFLANGLAWTVLLNDAIKRTQKQHSGLKKKLKETGLTSKDQNHAFAAIASGSDFLITEDVDFFDPVNKRYSPRPDPIKEKRVCKLLGKHGVEVVFPGERAKKPPFAP